MADQNPAPGRRARAPTITIDTSAGDSNSHGLHPIQSTSPTELRPTNSSDRDSSRPTSPHNVSSPTHSDNKQHFLAVPSARSRANSFDTDGGESSSTATYVNSSPDHGMPKAFGGDDGAHGGQGGHGGPEVIGDHEALHADPGTEEDFVRENNPFAFTPGQMSKMLNPKSLGAFHALGGLEGLQKGLRSDRNTGLSPDEEHLDGSISFEEATGHQDPSATQHGSSGGGDGGKSGSGPFADRIRIFSDNRLPEQKAKSLWRLAWEAYNDKVLLLLTGAAVVSLALGLYQTFGTKHDPGNPPVEWVEGVAIIIAILIVTFVGAINDWQKERQFVKLNRKKDDRKVKVLRSGKTQEISVHDILVGEVLYLEPGDLVPVDGILFEGHGLKCDESSATGESDILKKQPADEVWRAMEANESLRKQDPFILSGAKITEGVGKFLVTATGVHSSYGKTMMSLRTENEVTPLQSKLNVLAEYIAKLGGAAALLLFIVLFIKFCAQLPNNPNSPSEKAQNFLNILIVAVTIVVVAVPEGLPLAVTLALAFATKRMTKDNNLVRVLRSCETMGNATTVCSDKTGTLTQNVMTVVAGTVGTASRFSSKAGKNLDQDQQYSDENLDGVDVNEFISTLGDSVKTLIKDSIVLNSSAFEGEEDGKQTYIGSKTETALLSFARDYLGMGPVSTERSNAETVQFIPFDSGRKCMGVVVKIGDKYRLYVKGASEMMLRHCSLIIRDPTKGIDGVSISNENVTTLNKLIEAYASRSLRTIGLVYREFEQWPPRNVRRQEDDKNAAVFEDMLKDMTFLGVVGIQDPLRDGVTEAVQDCITAGVFPRMVTGDNILTAKAIATECGIFTAGGVAMEGPVFRKMSKQEQLAIIPKLQVLARSSPDDKRILVRRLKEMGETVAVTGDGTNDAPALKAADVGFSMGIAGTEVAKEASDIILMDDNFASIVKALMWGRAVNDAVQKFLQFQITVNITAVLLAFVSAAASSDEESVLTAVQLLWVNLIMDTFAALALATDPPTHNIINRKPAPKSAPLITLNMWKMIVGQAIYQLVVTFILFFGKHRGGNSVLSYNNDEDLARIESMIFNTFVWMQIFNEFNNRRLDNKFNIFEGVQRNSFFIFINAIMIGGQIMIMFVGGRAFGVTRLTAEQWGYSVGLGFISIPIGVIIRLIPDELIERMIPEWVKRKAAPQVVVSDEEQQHFEFTQALLDIRDELSWIRKYKGGRLNQLKFAIVHPREALLDSRSVSRSRSSTSLPGTPTGEPSESEAGSHSPVPPTPESRRRTRGRSRSNSAVAGFAMAGIVAGSVGAGWSPIDRGHGDADSFNYARARSRSDLSRESGLEMHPDTKPQDPVTVEQQIDGNHPPSQSNSTTPAFGLGPFGEQPEINDKKNQSS